MRGRPDIRGTVDNSPGNTPAYAGKTGRRAQAVREPQKHPRVCGEDPPRQVSCLRPPETPPRMRGRPLRSPDAYASPGNTPAYAGKTASGRTASTADPKHPRVCGEDSTRTPTRTLRRETPPRMRGRPRLRAQDSSCYGNTPAYAGKTHTEKGCRKYG